MASVSETIKLNGLSLPIVVTSHADAAAATAQDAAELQTKRALLRTLTVGGNGVSQLIRLQVHEGKLYVDIAGDADITDLTSLVGAMDLAAAAAGHPSPTEDPADTEVLAQGAP